MKTWILLCCGVLMVLAGSTTGSPPSVLAAEEALFKEYAKKIEEALGVFNDIKVFEQDSGTGPWKLVSGQYVPVTVNGKVPDKYEKDMLSDRPMLLPTRVEGFQGGDGQSTPYSVVGRMPGSNPEVQWVFVVRKYRIKQPTDKDFDHSGDIAVIGHHPRTGATAFLQFYDPENPKSGKVVLSPSSKDAAGFWSPITTIAGKFLCQRCHAAGPFIHTPWINQVRVREGDPEAEPMVPSAPLGPYFFIWAEDGELFAPWDAKLKASETTCCGEEKGWKGGRLNKPDNRCTNCHRVAPDIIGLYQNSTRYAGLEWRPEGFTGYNPFAVEADQFQTPEYRKLHWMLPVDMSGADFYAGQAAFAPAWEQANGKPASEVNRFMRDAESWNKAPRADVPRPPKQYQTIVVDRPHQDQVGPNQSVWIVDSRMRANTDGNLQQWKFYGKGAVNDNILAAPVVYRRKPNDGSTIEFEVVFVGAARGDTSAGQLVPVQAEKTYRVKQGDYFGVVFTNTGSKGGPAAIPYTEDDWAKLKYPDGATWLRDGSVTYRLTTDEAPAVGKQLVFKDAAFRTYSFEFKNKL